MNRFGASKTQNSTSWLAVVVGAFRSRFSRETQKTKTTKHNNRLHDSLWGFEKSKLNFLTRFGASKTQSSTSWLAVVIGAFRSRLSRNKNDNKTQQNNKTQKTIKPNKKQKQTLKQTTGLHESLCGLKKSKLDFMTRFGASTNQNSTSWLAVVIEASRRRHSREKQTKTKTTRLYDSLWGLEKSKLGFMSRCGKWGLQKSTQPRKKQHNKTTPQNKQQHDFMIRCGASKNRNSTSWLALGPRKVEHRLHDSLL